MTDSQRRARNAQRLVECYPAFAGRVRLVIADLESAGFRPRIQCSWRSPADQATAYASGHSKVRYGCHNVTGPEPPYPRESLAVDLLDDRSPLAPSREYLLRLAGVAQRYGLVTGIRWGLPPSMADAIDAAIALAAWQTPVKVGWDPTHVEPADRPTFAEIRSGWRPKALA